MTSKKILTEMQSDGARLEEKQIDVKKAEPHREQPPTKIAADSATTTERSAISTTENRMVIVLDGKTGGRGSKKENLTLQATKENVWPEFKESSTYPSSQQNKELPQAKTAYPWQNRAPNKSAYQRNFGFAYHRVTGKPSAHRQSPELNQRTHNAYIAVSVIAPKERYDRKDKLLENELRQLKPWNHDQNLKNMANIRSNWVIQNDDNDARNRDEEKDKRG